MIIAYIKNTYSEKRNIVNQLKELKYIDLNRHNIYNYFLRLKKVLNMIDIHHINLRYSFKSILPLKTHIVIHTFNTICYTRRKWVVTYETLVPRYTNTVDWHQQLDNYPTSYNHDKKVIKAIKALSKDNCKKIISLSECSFKIQQDFLNAFPDSKAHIEKKMVVLHPPQKLYIQTIEEKKIDFEDSLKFLFVGSAFFRKGGSEMLNAFKDFVRKENFHLTIVSNFLKEEFAAHETDEDIEKAKQFLAQNKQWITHYPYLPNTKVIELMKESHIGVLPTWADTYGYATLEFQACGCPVISTDIRALPEINPISTGWLIKVPKNKYGNALFKTEEDRRVMRNSIERNLKEILLRIFYNKEEIRQKAINSIEKIKKGHDPENYQNALKEIYDV